MCLAGIGSAIPSVPRRDNCEIKSLRRDICEIKSRRGTLRYQLRPAGEGCVNKFSLAAMSPAIVMCARSGDPWRRGPRSDPLATSRHLFVVSETSIRVLQGNRRSQDLLQMSIEIKYLQAGIISCLRPVPEIDRNQENSNRVFSCLRPPMAKIPFT